MAIIRPFAAVRPRPELAARICEPPYDVLSSDEARALAAGNPWSFLRVSKPEIDLPAGTRLDDPAVYARGRRNFLRLLAEGALRQDARPCFHFYRQVMGQHSQTGIVAVASGADYLEGVIRRHELTRPDKEDDRLRHIEALGAQTGPAFLIYRARPELDELACRHTATPPVVDFTAGDGVRHSAWVVSAAGDLALIEGVFARVPRLYIADGHHRSAAAVRLWQKRGQANRSGGFLAVLFPHTQVQILPYNRVVKDLGGLSPDALLQRLEAVFVVRPGGPSAPARPHELGLYLGGCWRTLLFRPEFTTATNPIERLDVALLQKLVLDPVFGISDPRTSERLGFVGGIRGPAELERLVDGGTLACAFVLCPPSVEDLMSVADAGGIMPPKSTWFEPKLRDGMFCHLVEG